MIGKVFGEWTILEELKPSKHKKRVYKTVCSCGIFGQVVGGDLRSGKSTKCVQCYNKIKGDNRRTHGKSSTKTFNVWMKMKERCLKLYNKDFKYYGGRGITIDEKWLIFQNFIDDMGEQPIGFQIDRTDNDKGYYKDNCRWVTAKQNSNNRRQKGSCTDGT